MPPPRPPPNDLATNNTISFAFCMSACFNSGFDPMPGTGFALSRMLLDTVRTDLIFISPVDAVSIYISDNWIDSLLLCISPDEDIVSHSFRNHCYQC